MTELDNLSLREKKRIVELLKEQENRIKFNAIDFYVPYGWQEEFCNASFDNKQLLAMTGNRCGKTYTGAQIMAIHLTGRYPKWWKGHRFTRPIQAWAVGASSSTTRDILQSALLGAWDDPQAFGTGAIPKSCILDLVPNRYISGAYEVVQVQHTSGGVSTVAFKSYEMALDKFMGTSRELIWLDEECPKSIFTQCVTRTATTGGIVYLTFTPENGLTELVRDFMEDLKPGQFFIQASWDDAPHLTESVKTQLLSVYNAEEREMRVKGRPFLGDGVCFPINPEKITIDPFEIPDHWLKIIGIDLGYDHPNGVACVALDVETDTYYLYDESSERKQNIPAHASAILHRGGGAIPVQFPHDAFKRDGAASGKEFINMYMEHGVNCLPDPFTNPPSPSGKNGGNSVEAGVFSMLILMQAGKFKVFSTCRKFLQEMSSYHRKNGKIVDVRDDMVSATRYAVMSIKRYGRPGSILIPGYYRQGKLVPDWITGVV
jgi:phage terminase large subunit-like protein